MGAQTWTLVFVSITAAGNIVNLVLIWRWRR